MVIKVIYVEGFHLKAEKEKTCEFEKELLKFVLARDNEGLSENLVFVLADRLRVSHNIEVHDLNIPEDWLQSFKKLNVV